MEVKKKDYDKEKDGKDLNGFIKRKKYINISKGQ